MNRPYECILDESIKLELNAADLYMLFFRLFTEDSDFWWKLTLEEKNHAALVRSIRDIFQDVSGIPESLFLKSLEDLKKSNDEFELLIRKFKEQTPSRKEAFEAALFLEESAGELHYQEFMTEAADDRISDIFRQLNGEDKDHADRIREYMEVNRISE
jgi:hypothetical protein